MCNISIYFCNTNIKHLQHTSGTFEILETYICNTLFSVISLCCLGMEARRMEFIGVDLVGDAELAALVEKDTGSPVEKAAADPRTLEGRDGREERRRGGKTSCYALARWRCRPADRRGGGEGGAVESAAAEAVWACGGIA
jgi:hypothetical protein